MRILTRTIVSSVMAVVTLALGVGLIVSATFSGIIPTSSEPVIRIKAYPAQAGQKISARETKTHIPTPNGTFFVLVIGNDYRPGVGGHRADGIHVVAVNAREKRAAIVNFPRDTNVAIPGRGRSKINAANAYGGSDLTKQTVEQLMGISISYVLEVDFAGFVGLVNDLGGLNVPVEKPMHDKNSGTNFDPGVVRMNGDQALAFSRDRYSFSNGDIQRTTNQGILLISALKELQAAKTSIPSRFESAALIAKNASLTNLTLRDLFFLMEIAADIDANSVPNMTVPWAGSNTLAPRANDLFADVRDNAILDTYR